MYVIIKQYEYIKIIKPKIKYFTYSDASSKVRYCANNNNEIAVSIIVPLKNILEK